MPSLGLRVNDRFPSQHWVPLVGAGGPQQVARLTFQVEGLLDAQPLRKGPAATGDGGKMGAEGSRRWGLCCFLRGAVAVAVSAARPRPRCCAKVERQRQEFSSRARDNGRRPCQINWSLVAEKLTNSRSQCDRCTQSDIMGSLACGRPAVERAHLRPRTLRRLCFGSDLRLNHAFTRPHSPCLL